MNKLVYLALIASIGFASCSKKNSTAPAPTNVIQYSFSGAQSDQFEAIYYTPGGSQAQNVYTSTWSTKVTIPDTTKSANIYFSIAQEPPYTNNNSGTVTIRLNGKVVATGTGQFTNSQAYASATFSYTAN